MTSYLTHAQLSEDLALRDLSDPGQGPHAMQDLLAAVIHALGDAWDIPTEILRHNAIVPVENNYDRLGFDADAVTRDQRYSRYLSPTVMLRSHTSASVPWLLTDLAVQHDVDRLIAMPGLVYRRDAIDRTHVGAPHQVDLWRVASHPGLTEAALEEMVGIIVDVVLPGARWRAAPAVHPYTVSGRQIDVLVNGEWLELAECGLISPALIERSGADSSEWSGLALGMGLDRALMLRKGIDDIRLLRSDDPRIQAQMLDLQPWQPVSVMPSIRRDLSVVANEASDAETLGDTVRRALGDRVEDLESVELLAVTPFDDLPLLARERLAIRPDQVNALLRITLRPLSRTMTDAEANELRDVVYRAVHEGPVLELISLAGVRAEGI